MGSRAMGGAPGYLLLRPVMLEVRGAAGYLFGYTKAFIMAQRTTKRLPASVAGRGKKRSEVVRLAASILENPKAASLTQVRRLATLVLADANEQKLVTGARAAADTTLEDRLETKAVRVDRSEFSGPSLGEMSREQRHKLLYSE